MRRWAFNIQIYYLHTRTRQLLDIHKENKNIIQDRTLYEDAYIFTPNLHAMGLMNTRDFENYQHIFELVSSFLQPPDLLIYLRADVPTLIRNIQSRGREYENSIRLDYLTGLNKRYEDWIEKYSRGKLIVVDLNKLDFVAHEEDLGKIYNMIDAEINSLFSDEI
jgi:deoxyadenosine/deoxycytidine kinase